MPDPLSHVCFALLVGRAARFRRGLAAFVIGTFLPDLLTSAPTVLLGSVTYWFWVPSHTPVGVLVWAYALSLLFRREDRRVTFACLLAGGWLALALDALQDHIAGGYMLLFPFSWAQYELHLIAPEASILWLPYLVGLTGLAELLLWLKRRRVPPKRA